MRVPTPNVSIVDLVVTVEKSGVEVSEVNAALKEAAEGELKDKWPDAKGYAESEFKKLGDSMKRRSPC